MSNTDAIRLDYNNVMADVIGPEHGFTKDDLLDMTARVLSGHEALVAERKAGKLPFMNLPYTDSVVADIKATVGELKDQIEDFVVFGIGGSALGNIALSSSLSHYYANGLSREARGGFPRVHVIDNIDPDRFANFLDTINVERTVFNVISKSGGTAETMSQFLITIGMLKERFGKDVAPRIIATTDAKNGHLRALADQEGYRTFIIPDGVGGRFSVLTPVGLLSAAFGGIDIEQLLAGAKFMDERCQDGDLFINPAYMNAVIHYLSDTQKGKNISVMMAYANRLYDIADWYRQLWAESLGKRMDNSGNLVHTGQTPVKALGVTDQHSQVQLYAEGPFDKIFTFLHVEQFDNTVPIPTEFPDNEGVGYLGGRSLAELIEAEFIGTRLALVQAQRPNVTIDIPRISPYTIGQLLYMYEVQTALAGKLYDIDAFDQPGVEAGKVFAYAYMGRAGYDAQRAAIEKMPQPSNEFMIG